MVTRTRAPICQASCAIADGVPAACPIGRSTAGTCGHSRRAQCAAHQRRGRLTRCANRPSKQRVTWIQFTLMRTFRTDSRGRPRARQAWPDLGRISYRNAEVTRRNRELEPGEPGGRLGSALFIPRVSKSDAGSSSASIALPRYGIIAAFSEEFCNDPRECIDEFRGQLLDNLIEP